MEGFLRTRATTYSVKISHSCSPADMRPVSSAAISWPSHRNAESSPELHSTGVPYSRTVGGFFPWLSQQSSGKKCWVQSGQQWLKALPLRPPAAGERKGTIQTRYQRSGYFSLQIHSPLGTQESQDTRTLRKAGILKL